MRVRYIKLSPTGNITVLVTSPVPRHMQGDLAAWLLDESRVGGEQVGYVEPASSPGAACRLQMMGGEFCGNASMSLGAALARRRNLPDGAGMNVQLEVSGCDHNVNCAIRRTGDSWLGEVDMPLPTRVESVLLPVDGGAAEAALVEMPGITHLIIDGAVCPGEERLRRLLPLWNDKIRADALGALRWDGEKSFMDPLVYVPASGTIVREHGCGSGSAAVAALKAYNAGGARRVAVSQPGGVITAEADCASGAWRRLTISGTVTVLEEGETSVECEE